MAKITDATPVSVLDAGHVIPVAKVGQGPLKTSPEAILAKTGITARVAALEGVVPNKIDADTARSLVQQILDDGGYLPGGGGSTPEPGVLVPPTFSPASRSEVADAVPEGTTLFVVSNVQSGATRSALSPNDGRARYRSNSNQTVIESGGIAFSPGTVNFTFTDTLPGADPVTTTLPVTITEVVTPVDPGTARQLAAYPMEGTGAPAGTVHTFGLPMRQGDLNAGDALSVRLANGTRVTTQVDYKGNTWPDGSFRHAVLHIPAPALSNGALNSASVWRDGVTATGTPINMATALSGRTARVEISNGSTTETFNCVAQLDSNRWFSGPLCAQTRQTFSPSRAAVGGNTNVDVLIDLATYSDGSILLEANPWNRRCFVPNMGDASFTLKIVGDNGFTKTLAITRSWLYSSVPLRARWDAQGQAVTDDAVIMKPDPEYVSPTGIIANYDKGLGILESKLQFYASKMGQSDWNTPYSNRDIQKDMGFSGARGDVGETTQPNAAWMISGDKRARAYAIGQAEAALGIPQHCFDFANGQWVNPIDRPYSRLFYQDPDFIESNGRRKYTDGQIDYSYGDWVVEEGHWPDSFTVPYAFTGRRSFLDGLLGQASYGVMKAAPNGSERGDLAQAAGNGSDTPAGKAARRAKLAELGEGANIVRGNQVRGQAWKRRQHQNVGALAPAAEQYGGLHQIISEASFRRHNARWAQLSAAQGPVLAGACEEWVYGDQGGQGAPWQMMMDAQMRVRGAFMKYEGAVENAQRICEMFIRLMQNQTGWFGADVSQYNLRFATPGGPTGAPLTAGTWTSTYAALGSYNGGGGITTRGDNFANVAVDVGNDYPLRLLALMYEYRNLCETFGLPTSGVETALSIIAGWPRGKTYTDNNTLRNDVDFSIVRYGQTRAAALTAPVVTSGQTASASTSATSSDAIKTIAYTGGAPAYGTVGSPYANVYEIRNGNVLYPKTDLSGQAPGTQVVPVSLTNAAGTSAVVNLSVTVSTAVVTPGTNIFGIDDGDIVEGWSFNRRLTTAYAANGEIARLQQDAETPIPVMMTDGVASRDAYLAAAGTKFVAKPVRVTGQFNGLHATTPYADAGRVIQNQALLSKLDGFVAVDFNGTQKLLVPGLNINSRGLGFVGVFLSQYGSNSAQRMVTFLATGQTHDYDNETSAGLIAMTYRVSTLRSKAGQFQQVEGAPFTANAMLAAGVGYTTDGNVFINAAGVVTDGAGGFTATFGAGALHIGNRGEGNQDAIAGQFVEGVLLKNPTKANVGTILANMRQKYGL